MPTPIDPPTLSSTIDNLVDWLELTAIFNEFRVARLDALLGSLLELEETAQDDIGERDRKREQLIDRIENEVLFRQDTLKETYPFTLTESAEELILCEDWRERKFCYYIVCLITTHISGSEILRTPPVDDLLTRLRNRVFQIVATLGIAGLSQGPAFSVGWPRHSGETIVGLLSRAAAAGGGFTVRIPPGRYTSPHEKDGGIDVIAWTAEGMPPPTAFYFGQTASGRNWPGKPVADHARVFSQAYIQDHMTGNRVFVTVIPYRVIDEAFWNTQNLFHMSILERVRLPMRAWQGSQLAGRGVPIDGAENQDDITQWIDDFIIYAQAA